MAEHNHNPKPPYRYPFWPPDLAAVSWSRIVGDLRILWVKIAVGDSERAFFATVDRLDSNDSSMFNLSLPLLSSQTRQAPVCISEEKRCNSQNNVVNVGAIKVADLFSDQEGSIFSFAYFTLAWFEDLELKVNARIHMISKILSEACYLRLNLSLHRNGLVSAQASARMKNWQYE